LVNFIIFFKSFVSFTKKDIDNGKTPIKISKICSCVREAFCLSYAIRKNNNLYLYFYNKRILVEFKGIKLRYLGPDERSQALLLLRALNQLQNIQNSKNLGWIKSTPGIRIRRFLNDDSFNIFINSNKNFKKFILINAVTLTEECCSIKVNDLKRIENLNGSTIVFISFENKTEEINLIKTIKEKKGIKCVSKSRLKAIDNNILYINYLIDKKENIEIP
jgi:tRNA pseudouridine-54 N-methylase